MLHDAGFDDTAEALRVALEAGQAIVALTEPITIRFPSGAWEYVVTERVPDVGDTLVRDGKTWTVAGVTESVDGHRVITMAPEVVKSAYVRVVCLRSTSSALVSASGP